MEDRLEDMKFSTFFRREGTIVISGSDMEEGPTMIDLRGACTGLSTGNFSLSSL
jgi:Fe-S cluster biogenesis protein NfuA